MGESIHCNSSGYSPQKRPSLVERMSNNVLSGGTTSFGTTRWAAPELIQAQQNRVAGQFTPKLDVYSFAVVMWEVATRRTLPFFEYSFDTQVEQAVLEGKRPQISQSVLVPDDWRSLMEQCWAPSASERPGMSAVLEGLQHCNLPMEEIGKKKKNGNKKPKTDEEKKQKKLRSEERKAKKARKTAKECTYTT